MLYFVEVRQLGPDHIGPAAAIREWLQDQGIAVRSFEHSAGGPGTTFRLGFAEETDAIAFAGAFRGRRVGSDADCAWLGTIGPSHDEAPEAPATHVTDGLVDPGGK